MKGAHIELSPVHLAIADVTRMGEFLYEINRINVPAPHRGKGHGRSLLKQLTDQADQMGVYLRLAVSSSGDMTNEDLTAWYERYGFRFDTKDQYMYRKPNGLLSQVRCSR